MVQPRKTRPYINERLLMGRKESNQTNQQNISPDLDQNHLTLFPGVIFKKSADDNKIIEITGVLQKKSHVCML